MLNRLTNVILIALACTVVPLVLGKMIIPGALSDNTISDIITQYAAGMFILISAGVILMLIKWLIQDLYFYIRYGKRFGD